MRSGARGLARFTLRNDETLEILANFRFARRSGVNAALRVQHRLVAQLREIQQPNNFSPVELFIKVVKWNWNH